MDSIRYCHSELFIHDPWNSLHGSRYCSQGQVEEEPQDLGQDGRYPEKDHDTQHDRPWSSCAGRVGRVLAGAEGDCVRSIRNLFNCLFLFVYYSTEEPIL